MQQVFSMKNMHQTIQENKGKGGGGGGGGGVKGTCNIDVPIHFANTIDDFSSFDRGIEEPEADYLTMT